MPGSPIPLPLDLIEMGLPEGLEARLVAVEPCPAIRSGPGCVVLTTVNHLNPDVRELALRDEQGRRQTVRPTGLHKFYSQTRDAWVSAKDLRRGEQLRGLAGPVYVADLAPLPSVDRVYNFTVEGEHCYRVSTLGALVHNCGCEAPSAQVARNWNEFQSMTKGRFATRAEAGQAWTAYKAQHGIVTGIARSSAKKAAFLRQLQKSGNAPKWMNQWLSKGKVPPGFEVDHIKPLSIGGKDIPSNMRLLDKAFHDMHHSPGFYRPWE